MKACLHKYRFELLLIALTMLIFNKLIFIDKAFYTAFVWPFNMVFLGIVSLGVFQERKLWEKTLRNLLFIIVIIVPLAPNIFFLSSILSLIAFVVYIMFYAFLFYSVMHQITRKSEVSEGIVFGSLSGFLLLVVIATFSFLLLDFFISNSFQNIVGDSIPQKYQQFSYFSIITLTTIGYGDITPTSEQGQLLAGFWGVVSQFYMVAIVGIIISKYTSNNDSKHDGAKIFEKV